MISLNKVSGFDWDKHNIFKNWLKHKIFFQECEEVFFNQPLLLFDDLKHSQTEFRYFALGKTNNNKKLFIVFTLRNNKIRIISARAMNKKEQKIYEQS